MPNTLRVNFENFGHTTKNKVYRLVKLLADLRWWWKRSVKRNLVAEAVTPSCLKGLLPYLITALKDRPEERSPPIRLCYGWLAIFVVRILYQACLRSSRTLK